MSDLEFFLAFLCPWIILGLIILFRRNEPIAAIMAGILCVGAFMALVSFPLDYFLASEGILIYDPFQSFHLFKDLPAEIPISAFAQSFLAGLALYFLRPRIHPATVDSKVLKFTGAGVFAVVAFLGEIMLGNQVGYHLGLVFLWAGFLLFFQWLAGSSLVWRTKGMFSVAVCASAVYFCVVEGLGIYYGLWNVDVDKSLGLFIFNIPIERALYQIFFALIACQGHEIFWRYFVRRDLFSPNDY